MAELNWFSSSFGNTNTGSMFFKLQPGENIIRIAGAPNEHFVHYEEDQQNKKRMIVCLGKDCPICELGHAPKRQYQCRIIDKSGWTKSAGYPGGEIPVKYATLPTTVMNDIKTFANDEDYGNPLDYDFKITKTGAELNTRYSVKPKPTKASLTEEELAAIKAAPSLDSLMKQPTLEDIKAMKLKCFNGMPEFMDDEEDDNPAASKNIETQVKDSTWDDFD